MPLALQLKDVSFAYEEVAVLRHVSLELDDGEFLLVLGPNGGGKTTLGKLLLGLLKPTRGELTLFGRTPQQALSQVGYVPQVIATHSRLPIRVNEVVRLGLYGESRLSRKAVRQRVDEALELVGLSHLARRVFSSLSGGERQRVLIARALVSKPRLLLLDEPTANVDVESRDRIYRLLTKLHPQTTIVLITHDPDTQALPVTHLAYIKQKLIHSEGCCLTPEMIALSLGTTVEQLSQHIQARDITAASVSA